MAKVETKEIRLITPENGAITPPLQRHLWPESPPDMTSRLVSTVSTVLRQSRDESGPDWTWYPEECDRSLPRPVTFAWELLSPNGAHNLNYDLTITAESGPMERRVLRGLTGQCAEVYNLRVGTPYSWKITAHEGRKRIGASIVGRFETHPAPPRWIQVPGITNVRDVGGWPLPGGRRVRQGMIYRGSEMNSHCVIYPAGRQVLVDDLGIHTDLDLRGVGEDRQPVLDLSKVEYVNIPVLAYDSIAHPEFTRRYRTLFMLLATRSAYPIFMHCWGGADRTGTVAFLLGALLGMSLDDLAKDYELTSLSIWGERSRASEAFQDLLVTLELFAAKGSSLQVQVERYLRVVGVTEEEIRAIRDLLIE